MIKRTIALATIISIGLTMSIEAGAQDRDITASAQKRYTDPLTVEFLGEIAFNARIDEDDDKFFQLVIAPGFGLFVVKGLQLGLQPQVRFDKSEDETGAFFSMVYGGVGIFVNYVIDVKSIVFPYLGVNFAGLGGKTETDTPLGTSESDFNIVEVGPQVGLKVVLGTNGILTLGFSYAFQSWGYEDVDNRSDMHVIWVRTGLGFWL
jgi:hypothetical protein